MKKKTKGHLTLEERQSIYTMRARGKTDSEIGKQLGRHRSVILRERRRNQAPPGLILHLTPLEKAKWAHDKALRRRRDVKKGKRGPLKLVAVRERVEALLKDGYSPEQIADMLSLSDLGVRVSGKTIRRWINRDVRELRAHLPERGKPRRKHLKRRKKPAQAAPQKRSIHERDEIVNRRERVGDLEADTIVCRKSKTAILSVVDRKTRRRWFRKIPNLKAETVCWALILILLDIPAAQRHTITFDRGSEFADWKRLEQLFGILVFFCDPYCAWQKGSVEHTNKEFRRFVPKGTDLALLSDETVARIEHLLNLKPMTCLQRASAIDVWQQLAAAALIH